MESFGFRHSRFWTILILLFMSHLQMFNVIHDFFYSKRTIHDSLAVAGLSVFKFLKF